MAVVGVFVEVVNVAIIKKRISIIPSRQIKMDIKWVRWIDKPRRPSRNAIFNKKRIIDMLGVLIVLESIKSKLIVLVRLTPIFSSI